MKLFFLPENACNYLPHPDKLNFPGIRVWQIHSQTLVKQGV